MVEKGGISDGNHEVPRSQETPFHAEGQFSKPAPTNDSAVEAKLQALSPDRPVVEASHLSRLNPEQISQLQTTLNQFADQCSKVSGPLRNVISTNERNKMTGNGDANQGDNWAKNYTGKVQEVLRDNIQSLSADMPFRVAIPVQSFVPGPNGMKAETLYAFFPPKEIDIQDRYLTSPLYSADAGREAQLRKQGLSMASSISSDELLFRCKVTPLNKDETLLQRKQRSFDS
jgi:hypothetical protein